MKKLININGQEGSNREQRNARKKKERKPNQTTRHSLSPLSADVLCVFICVSDVTTAVTVAGKYTL